MNQEGIVFQSACVAASWSADSVTGRWVAAINLASGFGTSAANWRGEFLLLDIKILRAVRQRSRRRKRWPQGAAREATANIGRTFPGIGRQPGNVDKRLHVGATCGRFGDDGPAVGMAYGNNWTGNALKNRGDVFGVAVQSAQWIRGGDDRVTLSQQSLHHSVPTGGFGECAMDQDNGRLGNRAGFLRVDAAKEIAPNANRAKLKLTRVQRERLIFLSGGGHRLAFSPKTLS